MLAVTLHNIKDFAGNTDTAGNTTFGSLGKDKNDNDVYFFQVGKTYDWVNNDGYKKLRNLGRRSCEGSREMRGTYEHRVPHFT